MARQRRTSDAAIHAVTVERAARLCRLVQLVAAGELTRAKLLQRLKIDLRGFYRDLQLLRTVGVDVLANDGIYALSKSEKDAIDRLPCPDPRLTLGEVVQLSKGRGAAQSKLRGLLKEIVG